MMASQVLLHAHENLLRAHEAGATRECFMQHCWSLLHCMRMKKSHRGPKALQVTSFIF